MKSALVALGLMWAQAAGVAPAPRVDFTVAASGDFLIHTPVAAQALADGRGRRYDFRPMFRSIRARIAGADLALCHMETPLVPGPVQGYPSFRTPPALAGDGLGRAVDELGQPARGGAGLGPGLEAALLADHAQQEQGVDAVLARGRSDQVDVGQGVQQLLHHPGGVEHGGLAHGVDGVEEALPEGDREGIEAAVADEEGHLLDGDGVVLEGLEHLAELVLGLPPPAGREQGGAALEAPVGLHLRPPLGLRLGRPPSGGEPLRPGGALLLADRRLPVE